MKVENIISNKGNAIANQFIITNCDEYGNITRYFQSYNSIIAKEVEQEVYKKPKVYLDKYYWDYSKTTGKYRNIFLGETKKETEAKIKSGEYILTNLN